MKSSLSCTATAAFRGFKGWFSGRSNSASEMDHIPFVVSACGYRAAEEQAASEMTETGRRWHPGLSLDNFS